MDELTLTSATPTTAALLSGQYWGELRIFAEVASAKSFNRAAEHLGISQPTIGRKVRRLQDLIGAQLFVATKNGVRLTQRGEELASALLVLDQTLFSIARDLRARDKDAEGIVRVSITEGMAAFFAAPAVPDFTARHPRIQLHLRSLSAFSELRENQTDMMLTVVPTDRPDLVCKKLGVLHFVPIASRNYITAHGMPTRDNIENHLILQSHIYEGNSPMWDDWKALCERARIAHYCDNPFAYGMLVKQGLGIGLLGSYATRERSAVALDLGVHVPVRFYGVALAERLEGRPVRIVYDWLCEMFDATNPWFREQLSLRELPKTLPSLDMMTEVEVG